MKKIIVLSIFLSFIICVQTGMADLIERYFPTGNFHILVPNKNIDYHSFNENQYGVTLVHHNYGIMDNKRKIGVAINYVDLGVILNSVQLQNICDAIYSDIGNRPVNKQRGMLLYKNNSPNLEFAYKQNLLVDGVNYLLVKVLVFGSELYTLKIMGPNLTICEKIKNSFRK